MKIYSTQKKPITTIQKTVLPSRKDSVSFGAIQTPIMDTFSREASILLKSLSDETAEKLGMKFRHEFLKTYYNEVFGKAYHNDIFGKTYFLWDKLVSKCAKYSQNGSGNIFGLLNRDYDKMKADYAYETLANGVLPRIFENLTGEISPNKIIMENKAKFYTLGANNDYKMELTEDSRKTLIGLMESAKNYKDLVSSIKDTFR